MKIKKLVAGDSQDQPYQIRCSRSKGPDKVKCNLRTSLIRDSVGLRHETRERGMGTPTVSYSPILAPAFCRANPHHGGGSGSRSPDGGNSYSSFCPVSDSRYSRILLKVDLTEHADWPHVKFSKHWNGVIPHALRTPPPLSVPRLAQSRATSASALCFRDLSSPFISYGRCRIHEHRG